MRLVGYSSDDLIPEDKDVWFVYLVNGEKRYYKKELDLAEHPNHYFLKKQYKPYFHDKNKSKSVKLPNGNNVLNKNFYCCYCGDKLTSDNQTRDHILAKDRGGSNRKENLRPCCRDCNEEKDNFMLKTYIQILEINLSYQVLNTKEYIRTQTKINNANKILKEIEQNGAIK